MRQVEPLKIADIAERVWEFGVTEGPVWARHMRLHANGWIGGHRHKNESRWELHRNRIIFLDDLGRQTTIFDDVQQDDDGRLRLTGRFVGPGASDDAPRHVLRELEPRSGLALPSDRVDLLCRPRPHRRRNLVVLGANEKSLHLKWTQDIREQDRNWDLCIIFYGSKDFYPLDDYAEYCIHNNYQKKTESIHSLMHTQSPLWNYDYFMFPDDDLMMSWGDLNKFFEIAAKYKLQLAQPSLTADSHIYHGITKQDPRYVLRYTSFVEIMTPMFSYDALRLCMPTFTGTDSAWGLDSVWPRLLGEPLTQIGIIDAAAVTHTRPGGRYDLAKARAEAELFQTHYDAKLVREVYGAIYATPQPAE